MNPCVFHVGSFSLGPNTHAVVDGGCQLAVIASNGISIYNDSSIKVSFDGFSFLDFDCGIDMHDVVSL